MLDYLALEEFIGFRVPVGERRGLAGGSGNSELLFWSFQSLT